MGVVNKWVIAFKKRKVYVQWWLLFMLIAFGSVVLFVTGVMNEMLDCDFTRISLALFILFYIFSLMVGKWTWRLSGEYGFDQMRYDRYCRRLDIGWFASEKFLTLGMIGTVIGFIYILSKGFEGMEVSNIQMMRASIKVVGTGMGTALYTTVSGLVWGLLLQLQLFQFRRSLQKLGVQYSCDVSTYE